MIIVHSNIQLPCFGIDVRSCEKGKGKGSILVFISCNVQDFRIITWYRKSLFVQSHRLWG